MGQMKEIAALREDLGIPESFPLYSGPGNILVYTQAFGGRPGPRSYMRFTNAQEYYNRLSSAISSFGADSVEVRFNADDLREMHELRNNRQMIVNYLNEAATETSKLPVTSQSKAVHRAIKLAQYLANKELELSLPDPE